MILCVSLKLGSTTQTNGPNDRPEGRSAPVSYRRHMRGHITLDDALVDELDQRAGTRRRSAFIAEIIRQSLDDARRWDDLEKSLGFAVGRGIELQVNLQ